MNSPPGLDIEQKKDNTSVLSHALSSPLVTTKLSPPRDSSTLIRRARLDARLKQLRHCRLALITAPAGFGKTTLMSHWHASLQEQGERVAWLSLAMDDDQLQRFMSYLICMIEPLHDAWRIPLRETLARDNSPQLQTTTACLLNELAEMGQPVFLLLDDVQVLKGRDVQEKLQYLLDHAPDNLHLCIGMRGEPELALTPLRYREKLIELTANDLCFTEDEAQVYFRLRLGIELGNREIQQLMDISEGWATGLQMIAMSQALLEAPSDALSQLEQGTRAVSRYFDEIVLRPLPTPVYDFLLRVSILEELTPDLCNAVTQRDDAEQVLQWLEHNNLFITTLDERIPCYRLHHLFAETLRARLRRHRDIDVAQLHALASHSLARNNEWSRAIRHALHTGNTNNPLPDLEAGARSLAEQGDLDTLLRWLKQLPSEAHGNSLQLQITLAWVLAHHFRFEECQQLLSNAEALASRTGVNLGSDINTEIRAVGAVCAILADDPMRAEQLVEPLLPMLAQLKPWIAGLICNGLSSSYLAQGRHAEVLALQRQHHLTEHDNDNLLVSIYRASILGQVYARQADLNTAGRFYQDALSRAENTSGEDSNGAISILAQLSELFYERRQWPELDTRIERRLDLIDRAATLDGLMKTYRCLIRSHQQRQDHGRAEQLIEHGLHIAKQRQWARLGSGMLAERIKLCIDQHKPDEAQQWLQQLKAGAHRDEPQANPSQREIRELILLSEARMAMLMRDYRQAGQALGELAAQLAERGRTLAWIQLRSLKLCCDWQLGRRESALHELLPLLQQGRQQMLRQSFIDTSVILRDVLQTFHATLAIDHPLAAYVLDLLNCYPEQAVAASNLDHLPLLSEREQEVLFMVSIGSPNKAIARTLAISTETVKWHLKNIYLKLAVSSRTQALIRAKELGMIA